MPACTYLTDEEVADWPKRLQDPALMELMTELAHTPERRWALRPIICSQQRLWFRPKIVILYALYTHIRHIEWQAINFPGGETSINLYVNAATVQTYLLGYLAGRHSAMVTREK